MQDFYFINYLINLLFDSTSVILYDCMENFNKVRSLKRFNISVDLLYRRDIVELWN